MVGCQQNMKVRRSMFLRFRLYISHALRCFFRKHKFKGYREFGKLSEWCVKNLIIPKVSGSTLVPTLYGFDMLVDPAFDSVVELQLFERGTYEAGTLHVIEKCLGSGDIFIDIGSNIGLMSLFASKIVGVTGQVYAFEPEPGTYGILKKNIEINGFNNIFAYDFALGSNKDTARIYGVTDNRGASTLLAPDEVGCGGKEVSINTLDSFICDHGISSVRMVKIDVEGWELEVLKGGNNVLSTAKAPIICVECSNLHPTFGGQLQDIFNMIRSVNKYRIFKLKRSKDMVSSLVEIENVKNLPSHDNLFCFLQEHIDELDASIFI